MTTPTPASRPSVIDAHHHLWDLERVHYPWQTPDVPVLYRAYSAADLEPLLKEAGVDATVIVQAADSFDDATLMLEAASNTDWIAGVVAWAPLTNPKLTEQALDRYSSLPKVKGIRHLISLEADDDWLLRPSVCECLGVLQERGLPFDVVAEKPRHLEVLIKVAEQLPELTLIIDHLGKPPIRERLIEPWQTLVRQCAEYPNVCAKISGLSTAADWSNWSAENLRPFIDIAVNAFGADRCMFGSDWPVLLKAGDYNEYFIETQRALSSLSEHDSARVFGGTAIDVYHLDIPATRVDAH